MRTIFMIGLIVIGASMAGWVTFNRDGSETTIKINRDEIRNDARSAFNKGREYLNEDPNRPAQPAPGGHYHGDQVFPANHQNTGQTYAGQQYPNQAQPYPNQPQQYPAPQYQGQQYAGQQQFNQGTGPIQPQYPTPPQQGTGEFYYPNQQHANRPPAPWETQQQNPQQRVPQRQF